MSPRLKARIPSWCPLLPALLLALSVAGCDGLAVTDARATSREAMFDQVWSDFDRYYAFFPSDGLDWSQARAEYCPQAAAARTDQELAAVIGQMLIRLHDQHVTLYTPFGTYADTLARRPQRLNTIVVAYYVNTVMTPGGHMAYGHIGSDVGYIRIPSFQGTDWTDIDEPLTRLPGRRGMIIDIRENGGGNELMARQVAGRFLGADRLARYLRYRNGPGHNDFSHYVEDHAGPVGPSTFQGNVVVLTDHRSFSAAESFVLFLQGAPRVTIVGDSTGGASGRPIARELPNGWTYRLSSWQEFTPRKVSYERVGLAPDSLVLADSLALTHGFDRQLEAAIRIARR